MSVQYPNAGPSYARPVPPDTGVCSPVPARLAHRVAHNAKRKSARPGYIAPGHTEPSAVNAERQLFLDEVAASAPHIVAEFVALRPLAQACKDAQSQRPGTASIPFNMLIPELFGEQLPPWDEPTHPRKRYEVPDALWADVVAYHEALQAWATRHHLLAPWILDMGQRNLTMDGTEPWQLDMGDARSRGPAIVHHVDLGPFPEYGYNESEKEYVERVAQIAASRALEHAKARLAEMPNAMPIAKMSEPRARNIRLAARWQVLPRNWQDFEAAEGVVGRDTRTLSRELRKLLVGMRLDPRAGLPAQEAKPSAGK